MLWVWTGMEWAGSRLGRRYNSESRDWEPPHLPPAFMLKELSAGWNCAEAVLVECLS